MAKNIIIYGGNILIDLTDSTVDVEHLVQGYTAYDKSGTKITGTIINGDLLEYGLTDGTMPLVNVGKVGQAVLTE